MLHVEQYVYFRFQFLSASSCSNVGSQVQAFILTCIPEPWTYYLNRDGQGGGTPTAAAPPPPLPPLPSPSLPPSSPIAPTSPWPGAVARSETSSLGMQAAPSLIPTSGTFFRGDLVMKTFLQPFSLFRWIKKSSCQILAKECALSTGKLPPYARSFRRRFLAFYYAVDHAPTNIILSWFSIPLVLKCAAKILKIGLQINI